jgi:tritrans,polycis-undecaprenyl-diphosphate synthase [geranylgeranyl-diphosphate specific]
MKQETSSRIKHVAIIMDGNRRFSKRIMREPWLGHEHGAQKVKEVLEWCKEYEIKELTLYAFSYENFNRPKQEFDALMGIFDKECDTLLSKIDELKKDGLKINFIGRIEMFPPKIKEKMHKLMDLTKDFGKHIVNFAMAYSSRLEVADAVKKIVSENIPSDKIDDKCVIDHLYLSSQPDLIIRTGGEKRLSNFLMLQSAYSELFFVDSLWPEFSKAEFESILEEFKNRERRFGR